MDKLYFVIKRYRELRNFSQKYMADSLNMSQGNYSKIEKGTIDLSINRLSQISELLNVGMFHLLEAQKSGLYFIEKNENHKDELKKDNIEIMTQMIMNKQIEIEKLKRKIMDEQRV